MQKAVVFVPRGVIGGDFEQALLAQFELFAADVGYELIGLREEGRAFSPRCCVLWHPDNMYSPRLASSDLSLWGNTLVYRGAIFTSGLARRYTRRYSQNMMHMLRLVCDMASRFAVPKGLALPEDEKAVTEILFGTCFRKSMDVNMWEIVASQLAEKASPSAEYEYLFDTFWVVDELWNALQFWKAACESAGEPAAPSRRIVKSWEEVIRFAGEESGAYAMMDAYRAGVPAADIVGLEYAGRLKSQA